MSWGYLIRVNTDQDFGNRADTRDGMNARVAEKAYIRGLVIVILALDTEDGYP